VKSSPAADLVFNVVALTAKMTNGCQTAGLVIQSLPYNCSLDTLIYLLTYSRIFLSINTKSNKVRLGSEINNVHFLLS